MAGEREFVARFVLPSGEQSVLQCQPRKTLAELKDAIWRKKAATDTEGRLGSVHDKTIRLALARFFHFPDDTTLGEVMRLFPVFRESNEAQQMPELLVIPAGDQADQLKRAIQHVSRGEPIAAQGYLQRQRKNSSKFKKCYCVHQSNTLFCFSSQSAFQKGRSADAEYNVGTAVIEQLSAVALEFRLPADDSCSDPPIFKSDNEADRQMWTDSFYRANFRHAKWVIVRLCECLRARGCLATEGIFRVAGSRSRVNALRAAFGSGVEPDLNAYRDEHVLADLIKITVRELNRRLFVPHVDFQLETSSSESCLLQLKESIARLNPLHHGLAKYLMRFLFEVAQFSDVNRMTPHNLGIMFGPNIFEQQHSADLVRGNYVTELMITHYYRLFEEDIDGSPARYLRIVVKKGVVSGDTSRSQSVLSTQVSASSRLSVPIEFESETPSSEETHDPASKAFKTAPSLEEASSAGADTGEQASDSASEDTLQGLAADLNHTWRHWREQSPALSAAIAESLAALEHEANNAAGRHMTQQQLATLRTYVDQERKWRADAMAAQQRLYKLLESMRPRSTAYYHGNAPL